ncbi:hypothetical protein V8Z80_07945 [Orrella sp. JC864]|uniref:hypothetical protein n=1 Tax=Orrella sp. JC864 TaxID=3120298 RepID=UPI00300AF269
MRLLPDTAHPGQWLAQEAGVQWLFGLHWAPLLGRDLARLARRRARALGATHYTWSGQSQASAGCARLRRKGPRHRHAAALAAMRAAGVPSAAMLLQAGEAGCWLAAWHAGAVVAQTDRVYGSVPQARLALEALQVRYPAMPVYGNVDLDGIVPFDWAQLQAGREQAGALRPVHGAARRAAWIAGACTAAGCAAWLGWGGAQRQEPALAADQAQAAWEAALDASVASVHWHTPADLEPVLQSLRQLPAAVTGWTLNEALCLAQGPGWLCQASYARGTLGRNRHLADVLPPGWQLRVDLLDGAQLSWRQDGAAKPLRWRTLAGAQEIEIDLATRLQSVMRLFTRVQVHAWQALPVEAPRDAAGQMLRRPDALPVPGRRAILLEGPLHAYALLEDLALSASWQRLHLRLASPSGAGLASHRAQVSLQGMLYEMH